MFTVPLTAGRHDPPPPAKAILLELFMIGFGIIPGADQGGIMEDPPTCVLLAITGAPIVVRQDKSRNENEVTRR